MASATQTIYLAAGCFWGVEHFFIKQFGDKLQSTAVGYIGGSVDSPTYKLVCSGKTGHAEAVKIEFDPAVVSAEALILYFYRIHDPTTLNRQHGDTGTQYRSGIYYTTPEQQSIAERITGEVAPRWAKLRPGAPIVTELIPAGKWWDAEAYHQVCFLSSLLFFHLFFYLLLIQNLTHLMKYFFLFFFFF